MDKAKAVLHALDIDITIHPVILPNILHEDGIAWDVDHDMTASGTVSKADHLCMDHLLSRWKDKKLLKGAPNAMKSDKVILFFSAGNSNPGHTHFGPGGVNGAHMNLSDAIKEEANGRPGLERLGRSVAHEILAHMILGVDHTHNNAGHEQGLTANGDKWKKECELISKSVADELRALDRDIKIDKDMIIWDAPKQKAKPSSGTKK